MEWVRSPLVLVAFGAYALVLFGLLRAYFAATSPGGSRERRAEADGASEGSGEAAATPAAPGGRSAGEPTVVSPVPSSDRAPEFRTEAARRFDDDKEPVFATDEELRILYRNRAARKLFGGGKEESGEPVAEAIGADGKQLRKSVGDPDKPRSASLSCRMPNGKEGTAQLRVAVLNRLPRIYAFRVTALEEERPAWLGRSGRGDKASTSLTRGGRLDFREVDPASVELSADQMLGPLREIDERLRKVSEAPAASEDAALQSARGRLRKLIGQIEEIDWMLQVGDGHLHLRPEPFRAYGILAGMAEAANRLASTGGPRLRLDPAEAPAVEPLLSGDRRIFEKVLTQLLTSAFRASGEEGIAVAYRSEPLESPVHSDDWYLFADEGEARSHATRLAVRIAFRRPDAEDRETSDLPAVIETLGSQWIDPKLSRRLDFVRKGRDSDLFGLTLARDLVAKLGGELVFHSGPDGKSEFLLRLEFENAG